MSLCLASLLSFLDVCIVTRIEVSTFVAEVAGAVVKTSRGFGYTLEQLRRTNFREWERVFPYGKYSDMGLVGQSTHRKLLGGFGIRFCNFPSSSIGIPDVLCVVDTMVARVIRNAQTPSLVDESS